MLHSLYFHSRPDTLDPALLRPGRLDRKIEISLPNDQARLEILKIHSGPITKHGEIDYEAVVKLSDGFNGADLRNVCTEAGLFAIRHVGSSLNLSGFFFRRDLVPWSQSDRETHTRTPI